MSDSDILQRYTERIRDTAAHISSAADTEDFDDCGCFGRLRGVRDRAAMLEFRKKNGNIRALGYGWLEEAEFDPSVGITLHFVDRKIRIVGRNLNTSTKELPGMFESILRHRVAWIREANKSEIISANMTTTVELIEW